MSKAQLRSIVGLGLILGHVIAFLLIFYRLDAYASSLEIKLGLVLAIAPITGVFALAAVRYIIAAQSAAKEKGRYDRTFTILAILLPIGFVGMIVLELALYPNGLSKDLDSLRLTLGILETGLGLVIGAFVEELFGIKLKGVREEVRGSGEVSG